VHVCEFVGGTWSYLHWQRLRPANGGAGDDVDGLHLRGLWQQQGGGMSATRQPYACMYTNFGGS
jgi:hypothetical protein